MHGCLFRLLQKKLRRCLQQACIDPEFLSMYFRHQMLEKHGALLVKKVFMHAVLVKADPLFFLQAVMERLVESYTPGQRLTSFRTPLFVNSCFVFERLFYSKILN